MKLRKIVVSCFDYKELQDFVVYLKYYTSIVSEDYRTKYEFVFLE